MNRMSVLRVIAALVFFSVLSPVIASGNSSEENIQLQETRDPHVASFYQSTPSVVFEAPGALSELLEVRSGQGARIPA